MNVVLHFSGGEDQQAHAVSNVKNLLADDSAGVEDVMLVANGDGVLLLTNDSAQREAVTSLAEDGVSFRACENSLGRWDLSADDVLAGVETVPAGVGEVVKREAEGYEYVKIP